MKQYSDVITIQTMHVIRMKPVQEVKECFETLRKLILVNKFSTLFSECEILGQILEVPWCCGHVNSSNRKLNKASLRNTKCWMSLTSKSIQGMNSRILKVFEPKLSIFTRHKHPSFSRILHIMFRFCCIVTFKKQPRV